jgi:hypothetical protein
MIKEFYDKKGVFLTGSTGFLGKTINLIKNIVLNKNS